MIKLDKATAYHEAGHAVIGRVLGLTCGEANIIPERAEMTAGYAIASVQRSIADWEARGRWRHTSMFRARIMMLMAGREAEISFTGRFRGGDGDDLREVDRSVTEADAPDDPERFLNRLRARTAGLVKRHREPIEKVAQALLRSGGRSARQIDRIVRGCGVYVVARINPTRLSAQTKARNADLWRGTAIKSIHVRNRRACQHG
jgi:ATP-dependent Zn protease